MYVSWSFSRLPQIWWFLGFFYSVMSTFHSNSYVSFFVLFLFSNVCVGSCGTVYHALWYGSVCSFNSFGSGFQSLFSSAIIHERNSLNPKTGHTLGKGNMAKFHWLTKFETQALTIFTLNIYHEILQKKNWGAGNWMIILFTTILWLSLEFQWEVKYLWLKRIFFPPVNTPYLYFSIGDFFYMEYSHCMG